MQSTCGINKVDEWNQLLPIQSSVHSSQYVEVPCYTSLPREDNAALEFRLDKTDTALDPSSLLLCLKMQVVGADGKPVPGPTKEELKKYKEALEKDPLNAKMPGNQPGWINQIAYSMFSSVEVFISDQKINPGSSYYPFMCYVLNLLYQSKEAKENVLELAGWSQDSAAFFDKIETATNDAFLDRVAHANNEGEYIAKVMLDTVFPARVLPVQTEFTLRFNRSPTNFCLQGKKDLSFRIKLTSAKLYALKMRLTDQALQRHQSILASEGVNYPMLRYNTRTMSMMKGAQNLDWVPISGVMPEKVRS